jgi:hypothetical protein
VKGNAGYVYKRDADANTASEMLPAIFRIANPLMQITCTTVEHTMPEEITDALESEILRQMMPMTESSGLGNAKQKRYPIVVHFQIDHTPGVGWVSRNPGIKPLATWCSHRQKRQDTHRTHRKLRSQRPGAAHAGAIELCFAHGWLHRVKQQAAILPSNS